MRDTGVLDLVRSILHFLLALARTRPRTSPRGSTTCSTRSWPCSGSWASSSSASRDGASSASVAGTPTGPDAHAARGRAELDGALRGAVCCWPCSWLVGVGLLAVRRRAGGRATTPTRSTSPGSSGSGSSTTPRAAPPRACSSCLRAATCVCSSPRATSSTRSSCRTSASSRTRCPGRYLSWRSARPSAGPHDATAPSSAARATRACGPRWSCSLPTTSTAGWRPAGCRPARQGPSEGPPSSRTDARPGRGRRRR